MYVKLSFCQYQMLLGMAHQARPNAEAQQMPTAEEARQQAAATVPPAVASAGASGSSLNNNPGSEHQMAQLARRYAQTAHGSADQA